MSRWRRWFQPSRLLLATLVVFVVAGVWLLWRTFSSGAVYRQVRDELRRRFGLDFSAASFVIDWRDGWLKATGVKLGRPGRAVAVAIDRVDVSAPFLQVWQGTALIDAIALGRIDLDLDELEAIRSDGRAAAILEPASTAIDLGSAAWPLASSSSDPLASAGHRNPSLGSHPPHRVELGGDGLPPETGSGSRPMGLNASPPGFDVLRLPLRTLTVSDLRLRRGRSVIDIDRVQAEFRHLQGVARLVGGTRGLPPGGRVAIEAWTSADLASAAVAIDWQRLPVATELSVHRPTASGSHRVPLSGELSVTGSWRGDARRRFDQVRHEWARRPRSGPLSVQVAKASHGIPTPGEMLARSLDLSPALVDEILASEGRVAARFEHGAVLLHAVPLTASAAVSIADGEWRWRLGLWAPMGWFEGGGWISGAPRVAPGDATVASPPADAAAVPWHESSASVSLTHLPPAWHELLGAVASGSVVVGLAARATTEGPWRDPAWAVVASAGGVLGGRFEVPAVTLEISRTAAEKLAASMALDLDERGRWQLEGWPASVADPGGAWRFTGRGRDFDVRTLKISGEPPMAGFAVASFVAAVEADRSVSIDGEVDIEQPRYGGLRGERLGGRLGIRYRPARANPLMAGEVGGVEGTGSVADAPDFSGDAAPSAHRGGNGVHRHDRQPPEGAGAEVAWRVSRLKLDLAGGGAIELPGVISGDRFDSPLMVTDVQVTDLITDPEGWFGVVTAGGRLTGSPERPRVELDPLLVRDWGWRHLRFAAGTGVCVWRPGILEFDRLRVNDRDGLTVDGRIGIDLDHPEATTGDVFFSNLDADRLPLELRTRLGGVKVSGRASGWVRRSLVGSVPLTTSRLAGIDLRLADERFSVVDGQFRMLGSEVEIESLLLQCWSGELRVQGLVGSGGGVRGSLRGKGIDLDGVAVAQQLVPGVKGRVDLEGDIDLEPNRRSGKLRVFVSDMKAAGRQLGNFAGEVELAGGRVEVRQGLFDRLGLRIDGGIGLQAPHPWQAALTLAESDLAFVPAAYGLLNFQPGDVQVSGNVQASGDLVSTATARVHARLDSLAIRQGVETVVANRPVEVRFQHGRYEVRSFELKYRQGVLGIEGTVDPHGRIGVTLNGRDFSVRALANLLRWSPPATTRGTLSIQGGVAGTVDEPRVTATLRARDVGIDAKRVIPSIEARCVVSRQGIRLLPVQVTLPNTRVTAQGTIGFAAGGIGDLDCQVEVASGPIVDLTRFFPRAVTTADGTLQGRMRFTGRWPHPTVDGNLRLQASALGFAGMRRPLRNVDLGVTHQQGRLVIAPLHALVGGGTLTGRGELDFAAATPTIRLSVAGKGLGVQTRDIDLRKVGLEVTVDGEPYRPVVRGRVKVGSGRVMVSERLIRPSASPLQLPLASLDYDVEVDAPGNFWLRNSFLNAEMRGRFRMHGGLEEHHLAGDVQTVRGYLQFQRRRFDIEAGEVRFGEFQGNLDPTFYVKSSTMIQNHQIYLNLEGRVSSFTSRLYSSPPLAEPDLFALLALGRSLQEVQIAGTRNLLENEILEGLKSTYLGGFISSHLSSALNLDELYYGTIYDKLAMTSMAYLRIGKYLTRKLFFVYEGTLANEGKKTYILEYRLPRGFSVQAEVEKPRDRYRFGVTYDWRF